MTVEINRGNFEEIVSREGILLIDCWAPWCRSCDEFEKAYGRVAEQNPTHTFAALDTQKEVELRDALGIEHVPTLLLYRDGVLLFKQPGSYDESTLKGIVAQAEALDMALVLEEMAKTNAEGATSSSETETETSVQ